MITEKITRMTAHDFDEQTAGRKLVLLYPYTSYRNVFLAYWLSLYRDQVLYYRVPAPHTTLKSFLNTIAADLETRGFFPADLKRLMIRDDPQAWGEALAAALNHMNQMDGKCLLYLDAIDYLNSTDHFGVFLQALVLNIHSGVQIAINSRWLDRNMYLDCLRRGDAVVLGRERRSDAGMFTIEAEERPQLEVCAFGKGQVYINGRPIDNWDGSLPRHLFLFLVDRPLVTRDEIFKTFWPSLSHKEATNVFHVSKRKIATCISQHLPDKTTLEMTQYQSGFYLPSDKVARHYDVSEFQNAIVEAEGAENKVDEQRHYERAVEMYRYPFLETVDMAWATARREQLRQHYVQALSTLGHYAREQNQRDKAVGYLSRALAQMPQRDDLERELIELQT